MVNIMDIKIKPLKQEYSWKTGLQKTLKNTAIFLVPSVLAYLAGVQGEYAPLAGMATYFIKNWYENKK
jgi:hypothetical protein